MTESLMTLQQASEFLQIDPDTLRALTRRGRVPAVKIGRQWRFDPGLLREWIREQSLQGTGTAAACRSREETGKALVRINRVK
jgi:excisionase family DNA binding protein